MKPLSLQADNSNRRMKEDSTASLAAVDTVKIDIFYTANWISYSKYRFHVWEFSADQKSKGTLVFNCLRHIFDKVVHKGTSKQQHCTPLHRGN